MQKFNGICNELGGFIQHPGGRTLSLEDLHYALTVNSYRTIETQAVNVEFWMPVGGACPFSEVANCTLTLKIPIHEKTVNVHLCIEMWTTVLISCLSGFARL